MVERVNTPHTGLNSLCCHETIDGRSTKHNHTPNPLAGQLSRHSCNQIPRGRYQCKSWAREPHGTKRGGGEATIDRERSQQESHSQTDKRGPSKHREEHNRDREAQGGAPTEASSGKTENPKGERPKGNAQPQKGERAAHTIRKVKLLTLAKDVVQVIQDLSSAV